MRPPTQIQGPPASQRLLRPDFASAANAERSRHAAEQAFHARSGGRVVRRRPSPGCARRRLAVEDPRMRQLLVDPAEASGIETLADQLEMSLSELVTLAIDKFFGDAPHASPTTRSAKVRAKAKPRPVP